MPEHVVPEISTSDEQHQLDLELYAAMTRIRYFEEAAYRAYEAGNVPGTVHASIGQEAAAVGVISLLTREDAVFSHHRGHGHALAKGVDPGRLMSELFGRADGVCGGKGGSMHVTDVPSGFLGSLAIVGSSVPIAVGVGFAYRFEGGGRAAVVFFGDGAANQGVVYEAFNLASIWELPVLFVCENNGFAISLRAETNIGGPGIVERARSFGLAAEHVDGQDVHAVRASAHALLDQVRAGQPALLECATYRFMGHSRGDPASGLYRTSEELEEWRRRDPLQLLAGEGSLTEEQMEPIRHKELRAIDAAVEFATASPPPPAASLMEDVWG